MLSNSTHSQTPPLHSESDIHCGKATEIFNITGKSYLLFCTIQLLKGSTYSHWNLVSVHLFTESKCHSTTSQDLSTIKSIKQPRPPAPIFSHRKNYEQFRYSLNFHPTFGICQTQNAFLLKDETYFRSYVPSSLQYTDSTFQ